MGQNERKDHMEGMGLWREITAIHYAVASTARDAVSVQNHMTGIACHYLARVL